jgi:hypothetical protein
MQKDIMTLLYSLANPVYDNNGSYTCVKVKVKFTLEQVTKAWRGSGSIALFIL